MRINLASGQRPFKDWVNVDIREQYNDKGEKYQIDVISDVKNLPFENESCDILLAHHLWEHIPLHEQEDVIREWYRVLKKGGILSIHIPNMKELAKAWFENKIDTFIFNVNTYGAYQGHVTDLHRWSYDEKELNERICCIRENKKLFDFQMQNYNPNNPLYSGSSIAVDWWIMNKEFVKM